MRLVVSVCGNLGDCTRGRLCVWMLVWLVVWLVVCVRDCVGRCGCARVRVVVWLCV